MTSPIPWETRSMRGTLFGDTTSIDANQIWVDTFGSDPDQLEHRSKDGVVIARGDVDSGRRQFHVAPGRLDLHALAKPRGVDGRDSCGKFEAVAKTFCIEVAKWSTVAALPAQNRLAFGASLFFDVADDLQARIRLLPFLPAVDIGEHESVRDFVFQINRPVYSSSDKELELNRLAKWSIDHEQLILIGPGGPTNPRSVVCLRCDLDINNVLVDGTISDATPIFEELAAWAQQLAINGDER